MISTNVLAEWTRVTGNDNGSSYVDFGTIKKKGRKVKMWILYDFKTIQKVKSYRYLSLLVPGKVFHCKASPEDIAQQTLTQLCRSVPSAIPSINFLSGGQTPEEATVNLNSMNVMAGNAPWELSFSYGRALQQSVLHA